MMKFCLSKALTRLWINSKMQDRSLDLASKAKQRRESVGVVTFPIAERGNVPLSNLVDILHSIFSYIYVVTGNEGTVTPKKNSDRICLFKIQHRGGANVFARIPNYIYTQLRLSYKLAELSRNVELWIFLFGEALVLPMLSIKLLRKEAVLAFTGSAAKAAQAQRDPLAGVSALLQSIAYRLSDRIIIYSERLIEEHNLQKYRNKISIAHRHFLDFDKFGAKKKLDERDNLIGYIGALTKAKGVLNLLEAIPKVSAKEEDVKFLIGGDGQLRPKVEQYLSGQGLNNKAKFVDWIPHDELPKYLSDLKLLVLPSYTEGLPNIILEAMACGTPVLATPVGAIPDIIEDGETGFLMEDNSPGCIARNVIRALNHPNLEEIAKNARALVEKEFTYEAVVKEYRSILDSLR